MHHATRWLALALFGLSTVVGLWAQPQPGTDTIVFTDGEKLIGHLIAATGPKVVFRSNAAGLVTVEWSKIQELQSGGKFVVIAKGVSIKAPSDAEKLPKGSVAMKDQTVGVTTSPEQPAQNIPVANVAQVMGERKFESGFQGQSFFHGWTGLATLSANIMQATATSRVLNTMAFIEHDDPPSSGWLPVRTKTFVSFNSAYELTNSFGELTKVSRWHTDIERDFYVKPRTFVFLGGLWEHNYTQGLDLTQAYGTGVGYNLVKKESDQLDIRAGIGFMHQAWEDPTLNHNLVGSRFGVSYTHNWQNGISFTEDMGVRPAWNYMNAVFGGGTAALTIPMYRHLKLSVNAMESFVNNPPPYFRKNLFQVSVGATYILH